jgi:energy-converting hydrogenase B subunit A
MYELINKYLMIIVFQIFWWRSFKMFLNRIYYGIAYVIVLIWEIIKSTIDTAIRAAKGGKTIDPVVIDIKTDLTRPISQTLLANSITLTPGTLTIDVDSENQVLKVAIIAPRDVKDVIPFEHYIKKMLE